jgi:hypothetical protein
MGIRLRTPTWTNWLRGVRFTNAYAACPSAPHACQHPDRQMPGQAAPHGLDHDRPCVAANGRAALQATPLRETTIMKLSDPWDTARPASGNGISGRRFLPPTRVRSGVAGNHRGSPSSYFGPSTCPAGRNQGFSLGETQRPAASSWKTPRPGSFFLCRNSPCQPLQARQRRPTNTAVERRRVSTVYRHGGRGQALGSLRATGPAAHCGSPRFSSSPTTAVCYESEVPISDR